MKRDDIIRRYKIIFRYEGTDTISSDVITEEIKNKINRELRNNINNNILSFESVDVLGRRYTRHINISKVVNVEISEYIEEENE